MRLARWGFLLMGTFWIIIVARGGQAERPETGSPVVAAVALNDANPISQPRLPDLLGAGSCSAVACHGSVSPVDRSLSTVLRNEHTTWLSNDSHARAYEVLYNDRSLRIERNLAADASRVLPAHQDIRCLACHTTPRRSADFSLTSRINSDGVGCESCHGPSGQWLGPHTTRDWNRLTTIEKELRGMHDTKDLSSRARLCAGCHVGDSSSSSLASRDVNHDLIAAGHPRLNFELAAFLDNMPVHWVEKGVNQAAVILGQPTARRAADFPARAWSIGRLVTAQFALELLSARAIRAGGHSQADALPAPIPAGDATPWPEFAEYNCFSCHHDLRDQAWRRTSRAISTNPGAPRWGSWTFPGIIDLIAPLAPSGETAAAEKALRDLIKSMEQSAPAGNVFAQAQRAAHAFEKCLEPIALQRFDAEHIERLIAQLENPDAWKTISSWDEATQRYLGLVALRQSWVELAPVRRADQERLATRLYELRDQLSFPPGFDSPKGFEPKK